MSGSERSSFKVTGLRLRPIAWLAVPFVALLQFVTPAVVGAAPAAQAATAPAPAEGTAKIDVAEYCDKTLDYDPGASPVGGHGCDPAHPTPITDFKWMISAEHTNGAYDFAGLKQGQTGFAGLPAYDATGETSKDAGAAQCLPYTDYGKTANGAYDPRRASGPRCGTRRAPCRWSPRATRATSPPTAPSSTRPVSRSPSPAVATSYR